ncbi:HNH endonuclease [Cyanobium sp. Morenito 9A2]|uniref:HNH endonuclease n=1 Tax=Cyanobium sp. Morenito 9A2 TaxID=2823718 RepID=UPI0020CD3E09|nr:HNH endonuclease [Cyanobium sp. Morenito 9A2]MCP9848621.1 HNH endonuclease [Cyanobium sp. Morenito 9A2]
MANHKRLPPAEFLRQHLSYDPRSGHCRWTAAATVRGQSRQGERAGSKSRDGRWHVAIEGQRYALTRIIWCLHHGVDPIGREITPINGNRDDHRINNLRATPEGQPRNPRRSAPSDLATGFKGVTQDRSTGRFRARILMDGRRQSLGEFDNKYDAFLTYVRVAKAQLRGPTA